MRSDSRTDHTDDDRESAQPAAYPVFTGDRDPSDIPVQRHGESPFGTPPGGYATPPEPVDEFDRGNDDDERDRTEYPATEHTADERAAQAPTAGADDSDAHTRHTFADADARTDRSDHGGTDRDEVAVGRASVPGDAPTLDPDEREAVASTAPTPEDYRQAHSVATDPVDRDDLDVRPTVLHGTGTDGDGTDRTTGHHDSAADPDALPDHDTNSGHSATDADADRPSTVDTADTDRDTGHHDNAAGPGTTGFLAGRAADGEDRSTHHDEEEAIAFPATETASDERTAEGTASDEEAHGEIAEELKPGDAEVAPVPTFWAAADTDGYRDRWREAQLRFVDDPKAAAEEIRGLVGEAAEAVANALTEQRRNLDAWNGEGDGPRDTEQLRVVIQRYRTFFERLLNL
jgi:hypothetical protein